MIQTLNLNFTKATRSKLLSEWYTISPKNIVIPEIVKQIIAKKSILETKGYLKGNLRKNSHKVLPVIKKGRKNAIKKILTIH